ncbi:MAG: hypothetical protein M1821_003394 [Bathelium mastoideum]|nr:MAG: hypothetical protein M1821_003394 [Bathelium mastoideum]
MDSGNITVQVISNSFGISSSTPEAVSFANDELASAVLAQSRFRGLAALPMKYPTAAAAELQRCVEQLGFLAHLDDGRYYDGEAFHEIFAMAEKLDVPVYIHPTTPTDEVNAALFKGNYDFKFEMALGIAGWGWHCDTALSVLKMYAAGVFEKFPKLKVVIGHMGEMLPFMLDRIEEKLGQMCRGRTLTFKETWDQNIWITTSGMFTLAPMACVVRSTRMDRIMYSVDYPYSENEQGHQFLEELRKSGMVTEKEFDMIAYRNAETLLRIQAEPR